MVLDTSPGDLVYTLLVPIMYLYINMCNGELIENARVMKVELHLKSTTSLIYRSIRFNLKHNPSVLFTLKIHALKINTYDIPSQHHSTTWQNGPETQPQRQNHEHIHTARLLTRVPSPLDERSHKRTTSIISSLQELVRDAPTLAKATGIKITHLP